MLPHSTKTRMIGAIVIAAVVTIALFPGDVSGSAAQAISSPQDRSGWCPTWQEQYEEQSNIVGVTEDTVFAVRHRADSAAERPENSLAAFKTSYQYCRAAIETDVRLTQDGQIVAFHDANVGKMLEPDFDPITRRGPNERLSQLTLAQIQAKRLVNTATRRPTEYTVPTIREVLEDYLTNNGQSILVLDVKKGAIITSASTIKEVAAEHPDADLFKRVVLKIVTSEYPTPDAMFDAFRGAGIADDVQVIPTMNPLVADEINALPYSIPDIPGKSYGSNATRAVAQWVAQPGTRVPSVQVLVKDSSDFVHSTTEPSPQGDFAAPTSLTMENKSPGTMAEMAMVVKEGRKALAAFVPVPDYIMWRTDRPRDISVPNVIPGKRETLPVTEALYQDNSSCCYQMSDRLSQSEVAHEFQELRMNLTWLRRIGVNVLTTDDADSVETFYRDRFELSVVTTPRVYSPPAAMNSRLSWDLGYVQRPQPEQVRIKAWGGGESNYWGGQACIWDQGAKLIDIYGWVYSCANETAYNNGYDDNMTTRVHPDGTINIVNARGQCLASDARNGEANWWHPSYCDGSPATRWTWTRDLRLRSSDGRFLAFSNNGALYHALPYGVTTTVPASEATDSWSQWAILR